MKTKLIPAIAASLLVVFAITAPVCLTTGCRGLPERPPQTIALDTLKTTYETTREAYKGAIRAYNSGKISDEKFEEITKAWNDFRRATRIAVGAASMNWNTPPTSEVLKLQTDIFNFIKSL